MPVGMVAKIRGSYRFHGQQMASGPIFNRFDPTHAAHKTLPFCTRVTLLNLKMIKSSKSSLQIVDRLWLVVTLTFLGLVQSYWGTSIRVLQSSSFIN